LLYDEQGDYNIDSKDKIVLKAKELFKDFNEDKLNDLFQRRVDNDTASLALKAFNAWIMFNNFDNLTKHFLKDTVKISQNDVGVERDISSNKYKIVDKTGLVKIWRTSEDINAIDELGSITTLLIEQIPLYEYGDEPMRL